MTLVEPVKGCSVPEGDDVKIRRVIDSMRSGLWFVPVVCVVAGGLLSMGSIAIDRDADYQLIPESISGGPDAALAILSTIALSMVTLTVLVLTITMVVVQLAMGQFSPRIVQTFLQDKPSQFAIGLFVATFAHSMLAMREVHFDDPVRVPGLAIVVAYSLVVVSIVVLVLYVDHIGRALRVSSLLELVGQRTRELMDEEHPVDQEPPEDPFVVASNRSGVLNRIAHDRIVAVASEHGCTVVMTAGIGEFVPAGSPLFRLSEPLADQLARPLRGCVLLGLERTLDRDMAYGFRLLVDMAERSIAESPLLDPTTAVQAIDRLHDCLRQLSGRPIPTGDHRDDDGVVRLHVPTLAWDDYVHLAFDELVLAGRASPTVHRHLDAALVDLCTIAPLDRREVLVGVAATLARSSAVNDDVLGPSKVGS
jgi:uncharacterized membrane protein